MRLLLPTLLILAAVLPALVGRAQENPARENPAQQNAAPDIAEPVKSEGRSSEHPTTGSTDRAPRTSVRGQSCLSGGDMREVVSERKVMEPIAAIRAAREVLPRAEFVRVNLCHREGEPLFYLITALRRDGQFVHLTVDSQSGAVATLQ
jgi:hypothetical protein